MPRGYGMGPPWWDGRFRGCGYRMTVPRQSILDVLSKTSKHLSAEDVYMAVHKIYPNVGLTTVYRTLELLVQMGLVFKFDFGDKRARYELTEGPKGARHHHHLICTACGRVVDYTFIVDGKLYAGQDIVPAKLNFKDVNFKIVARKDIYVKYDKSNPYNNIITRQQKPMHKQYY